MKVRSVRLQNVRGFRSFELTAVDQSGAYSPLFVTGKAASGKTALLEAIIAGRDAVAPGCRAPDPRAWAGIADGPSSIRVSWEREVPGGSPSEVTTIWSPSEPGPQIVRDMAFGEELGGFSRASAVWKIEYFNAGRALRHGAPLRNDASERLRRTTIDPEKYSWVRDYLVENAAQHAINVSTELRSRGISLAPPDLSTTGFGANVAKLSPRLRWIGVDQLDGRMRCLFARKTGETVELEALSGSEAMIVLFAATFAALGLERSLILIDLPEQGIHPEDQAQFLEGLSALSPNAQIIAATTSPALLRNAPRDRVVVLDS